MFEVSKGDELDDVPEDGLSFGGPQDPVIAVQHLHIAKVRIPDSNYDDGHGEVGRLDDGLPGVGHVSDDAVRQNQQDEVLLGGGQTVKLIQLFSKIQTLKVVLPWPLWCGPPAKRTWQPSG